jgi:hypothetical protein
MSYKQPAVSTIGVIHEKEHALIDCRDIIWERGNDVKFLVNNNSAVNRDKFNAIKSIDNWTPAFTIKAYPINYSPTEKDMLNAGIKERTQVIIYTAMQDWNDNGYTLQNLKNLDMVRWRISLNGEMYEMRDKNLVSHYYNTFLYVTLGLNKK